MQEALGVVKEEGPSLLPGVLAHCYILLVSQKGATPRVLNAVRLPHITLAMSFGQPVKLLEPKK